MSGSTLSTHVLDAALGRPAVGVEVVLSTLDGAELERGVTDDDGRLRLDAAAPLAPGAYRLRFATGPWFAAQQRTTLFPLVELAFEVAPDQPHHHLALLLSPFAYTTYRGS
ncbi:hydroxyisourate hydrolase [Nocardioides sp. TRM66260-LWL]|uniref:hydroxyisourate hydrolase n=1 Tax=Nocardioides sp. TRM66260-LWL TaxID=2874478 RepID=UPI001CC48F20|nr:hydroxyisourate hydrolase [Nocardioides sp. TRM66260-LWL]MBZ5734655.1 hydroxyisourate hydrolase [Nocardioides sp. TRM66260-LWL]